MSLLNDMSNKSHKTYTTKASEIERDWHFFDAEGLALGRLASRIAPILMGKNKPNYAPYLDMGDCVVVVNAGKFMATGKKETGKIYYRHSQYPGHLKAEPLGKLRHRRPLEPIRLAVKRMLPANRLRDLRMSRLRLYAGPEHPHQAQLLGNIKIQSPKSKQNLKSK